MKKAKAFDTRKLVLLALLTAIVVVLQFLGAFIKFGPFSVSLVLLPIAVGAALLGVLAGGWLGLVFGLIVLLSGDAAAFLMVDALATVVFVLLKGTLAGIAAGLVYRLLDKKNRTAAAISAAVVTPIVNTGIFAVGAFAFIVPSLNVASRNMDEAFNWVRDLDLSNPAVLIFVGFIGLNFFFELGLNLILSPTIVRLIQFGRDRRAD